MDREMLMFGVGITFVLGYLYLNKVERPRRRRRWRIREINKIRKRSGFFEKYFKKMKNQDCEQFFKYTRMTVPLFMSLLNKITPLIHKRHIKDGISPEEQLAVTLHFLSQGSSLQTIAWKFAMGHATVHSIVTETCEAIWKTLQPDVLKPPSSAEEWLYIAKGFYEMWNFPNCLGALDGKHIRIRAPGKSGSKYYNYKGYFSTVLLATCDANYLFTLTDIGAYGSQSDGGVFSNSVFGRMLEDGRMDIPKPAFIPGTTIKQPFAFVGDAAFPLKAYIQRPYPGRNLPDDKRIFNYRLSRARRCIENAFGIMASRWRLLQTEIIAEVENVDKCVKAIVCLHNYVKLSGSAQYCPAGYADSEDNLGSWRDTTKGLQSVGRISSNRASRELYVARNVLKDYFMSDEGALPWQHQIITEGFV